MWSKHLTLTVFFCIHLELTIRFFFTFFAAHICVHNRTHVGLWLKENMTSFLEICASRYREHFQIKAVTHFAFQQHFYFGYDNVLTQIPISATLSGLLKETSALKTILSKTA